MKFNFTIVFIFSFLFSFSQSIYLDVLNTNGGKISNENINITYSIGQPIVGTISNSNNNILQGFQQNYEIEGCIDSEALNYDEDATIDDGSCIDAIYGCTDSEALNFNEEANIEDESCNYNIFGCTDEIAYNFDENANTDDGSCIDAVYGCTDSEALNYEENANTDDGSCCGSSIQSPEFGTLIGSTFYGIDDNERLGSAISISELGNVIAIGSNGSNPSLVVYNLTSNDWLQLGDTISTGSTIESISMSEDGLTIAVGSPYAPGGEGGGLVKVFRFIDNNWIQLGQVLQSDDNINFSEYFGSSVSLSFDGNIIGIGSPNKNNMGDTGKGRVAIFEYDNNEWNQLGNYLNGDFNRDSFGKSVDLSSDGYTIAIGATAQSTQSPTKIGYVEVYSFQDNNWSIIGEKIQGNIQSDGFGSNVSISSNGNLIATHTNQYENVCRVYSLNNNSWQFLDELAFNSPPNNISLSDDGLKLIVSTGGSDNGAIYFYEFITQSFEESGVFYDDSFLSNSTNSFGLSLSLSGNGNVIIAGSHLNSFNGFDSDYGLFGSASIFSTGVGSYFSSNPCYGCTDSTAINYDPYSLIEDESCLYAGCTDSLATNYSSNAYEDDGSCIYPVYGCTDSEALNYDENAIVEDGSCAYCAFDAEIIYQIPTNQTFCDGYYAITPNGQSPYSFYFDGQSVQQYNAAMCNGIYEVLITDANNCIFEQTLILSDYVGCMDSEALNYDETALFDNGTCEEIVIGCMEETADNYNSNANVESDECIYYGCTDVGADNFDPFANDDDGSCIYCDMNIVGLVNNPNTSVNCNGLIILSINSSHDPVSIEWSNGYQGGFLSGVCPGEYIYIATDAQGCELSDTVFVEGNVQGCTDPIACNYQEGAGIDDGSCLYLDPLELVLNSTIDSELELSWSNYNNSEIYYIYKGNSSTSLTIVDSTSALFYLDENINLANTYYAISTNSLCDSDEYLIFSDPILYTYSEELSIDIIINDPSCLCCNDGSVSYVVSGGTPPYSMSSLNQSDSLYSGQQIQIYVSDATGSFPIFENFIFGYENETYGCTDVLALNYDDCASIDDSSCVYEEVSACDVSPQGLFVDNIIHNRVKFNWSEPASFPSYYMIRYRPIGASSWTVMTAGPNNSNEFTGTSRTRYFMQSETTYQWNLRARDIDEDGNILCQSPWSETNEFTTLPDCPNLINLEVNTEANWVDFMADASNSEIEIYDSKGKLRIIGENNFRYVTGTFEGIDFRKGNFIPSTNYEWHTKSWCEGNLDDDGNPDPQYHSGWGDFSEFTTEDLCDKLPLNLITTTNGSQNLITMNWDTPLSGEPDHYFLELNNETTGQLFQWNNISASATSKTKYNQVPGHSFSWRIRGACGSTGTSWATVFSQPEYYTLGAGRLSYVGELNIYPNPSRNVFNIDLSTENRKEIEIRVVNSIGQEIYLERKEIEGLYSEQIDLSNYSKGVYSLTIKTSDGISNHKLILQ